MCVKFLPNVLRKTCSAPLDELRKIGDYDRYTGLTFRDKGANVLAIAHIDTVFDGSKIDPDLFWSSDPNLQRVTSPTLDDRLGVYTLCMLPINVDILLTENEEFMCSTGEYFDPPRDYNWMFQFDRSGSDVVCYQYESRKIRKTLNRAGFRVGNGTYSDICEMEHLGCKGFNFGTGYYKQHTLTSYMHVPTWHRMVNLFLKFYDKYQYKHMYHQPVPVKKKYKFTAYEDDSTKSAMDEVFTYQIRYHGSDEWINWTTAEWSEWMRRGGG